MTEYKAIIERLERIENQLLRLLAPPNKPLTQKPQQEWCDRYEATEITGLRERQVKEMQVVNKDGTSNPQGIFRVRFQGASTKYYVPDLVAYANKLLQEQASIMRRK